VDKIASLISLAGPEAAYKIIAKQAGISDNTVQSKLLRNWLLLTTPHQDVYTPSPEEVAVINPSFSLLDADTFKKDLQTKRFTEAPQQFTGHYDILGAAFAPATIGHFIAHIDATTEYLNTSLEPWHKATGTFWISDTYDFDVKDEAVRQAFDSLMRTEPITEQKFQGRSNVAELKTYIMNRLGSKVPHKDFDVLIKGSFEQSKRAEEATIWVGK
jgi:hypothetical protein